MIERRQHERWPSIQADGADSVKATPSDPLASLTAGIAFPILAVAADGRRSACVMMDAKLRVFSWSTRYFRDCGSPTEKVALALESIEHEIRERSPATLVLEETARTRLDQAALEIADRAAREARERGISVRRISVAEASSRIAREEKPTFRRAVVTLLPRYAVLQESLGTDGALGSVDIGRWREHRSLLAAVCLGHAVALDVILAAARQYWKGPPPSSQ